MGTRPFFTRGRSRTSTLSARRRRPSYSVTRMHIMTHMPVAFRSMHLNVLSRFGFGSLLFKVISLARSGKIPMIWGFYASVYCFCSAWTCVSRSSLPGHGSLYCLASLISLLIWDHDTYPDVFCFRPQLFSPSPLTQVLYLGMLCLWWMDEWSHAWLECAALVAVTSAMESSWIEWTGMDSIT